MWQNNFFDCPNGVKQGCILSPILFSLLVQEITNEIHRRGGYGIQLFPDLAEVSILLFADDIVLINDSVFELQKKLDILYDVAVRLGVVVNMDKSKVVVFRKGGHLAGHDRWHIGNTILEVVSDHSYLGLIFSTKLYNNVMLSRSATRGKIVFCRISSLLNRMNTTSYNILCKMFDAQVQPILLYGSELWGLNVMSAIENVHLFSLKKLLQVPIFTPNVMVYGDSGRYELRIHAVLRSIKYWIRILNMKDSRNVRKVYNMMRYDGNHQNWCCKIKELLIHFNFEDVWDLQQLEQPRVFLNNLKLRMIAESDKILQQTLQESNRYFIYKNFKQSRYKEMYLNHIKPVVIRRLLSRFKMAVSAILTHKYRFVNDKGNFVPYVYGARGG